MSFDQVGTGYAVSRDLVSSGRPQGSGTPGKRTLVEELTPGGAAIQHRALNPPHSLAAARPEAAGTGLSDDRSPRAMVELLFGRPAQQGDRQDASAGTVQRRGGAVHSGAGGADPTAVHASAERGIATPASALPHADLIQRAFGHHDISSVRAHLGDAAAASAHDMGAAAYATGNHAVFAAQPTLHTAAHEAAHIVQQRGGIQLQGGVGEVDDVYEQHANEVAALVVQGKSSEAVLDTYARDNTSSPPAGAGASVQRYTIVKPGTAQVGEQDIEKEKAKDEGKHRRREDKKARDREVKGDEREEAESQSATGYGMRPSASNEAGPMFPRQEYDKTLIKRGKPIHYDLGIMDGESDAPALRVADSGQMAIEHTAAEPRIFYAAPEVIAESNARLEDVGSMLRLDNRSVGHQLDVPADPQQPWSLGNTRSLDAVVPRAYDKKTSELHELDLDIHECNAVASKILAHGRDDEGMAVFQPADEERAHHSSIAYEGGVLGATPRRIADFAATQQGGAKQLTGYLEAAPERSWPEKDDFDRRAREELKKLPRFMTDAFDAKRLNSNAVIALATAPEAARAGALRELEKYFKAKGNKDDPKLDIEDIRMIIERYQAIHSTIPYGRMMNYDSTGDHDHPGDQRSQELGINQYAHPEVGESFAAFSIPLDRFQFNHGDGSKGGQPDLSKESKQDAKKLDRKVKKLKRPDTVGGLVEIAAKGFFNFKRHFWTWHFAAVVARTGVDAVTLENYNRHTTTNNRLDDLYVKIQEEYSAYKELRVDMKRTAGLDTARKRIAELAKLLSEKLKIEITGSNERMVNPGAYWYFQMYGPANKVGEQGQDQSFHSSGTDYVNPLTLRIAAPADDKARKYKAAMVEKLGSELGRRMLMPGVDFDKLVAIAGEKGDEIMNAVTRTEVAKIYRDACAAMDRLVQ